MKRLPLLIVSVAVLALAACNKKAADTPAGAGKESGAPIAVARPANGDWSTVTTPSAAGGFILGDPNAKVKLIEYGSMTCPHCAAFDKLGAKPLIDNYVKAGTVSWEYRNYVRDPLDITAALVARCNGAQSFFGLTRAFYASQRDWFAKLQTVPQDQMKALEGLPPAQLFPAYARLAGFPEFAALRGVPVGKTNACLADQTQVTKLVQMNSDAEAQYSIPGTPTFILNGTVVDLGSVTEEQVWPALETKLKAAIG